MSKFDEILNSSNPSDALLGEQIDRLDAQIKVNKTGTSTGGSIKRVNGLIIVNFNFTFVYNGETDPEYSTKTNLSTFTFPEDFAMKNSVYGMAIVINSSWNPRSYTYLSLNKDSTTGKPTMTVRPVATGLSSGSTYRVLGQLVFGTDVGDFVN